MYSRIGTLPDCMFSARKQHLQADCELFSGSVSHISFLDADNEYIKAEIGTDGLEYLGRAEGFCALTVLQPEVMSFA